MVRRASRLSLLLVSVLMLSACALPRQGPTVAELSAPTDETLPFALVEIDARVARATRQEATLGFAPDWQGARALDPELIGPGDELVVTVWENGETGLFTAMGIGAATLPRTRVARSGMIHVPYVGRVRAAGRTVEALRESIRVQLSERTPEPQVDVFRAASDGRRVSLQGVVARPGLYPISAATTRMLAMLAEAGGIAGEPEAVRLRLRRGTETGTIWLEDLYDRPEMNVALRAGDTIVAERDRRSFTALGAVGARKAVPFPVRELSVARALGAVGGLVDATADPTGVFVLREESPAVYESVVGVPAPDARHRMVYALDLTKPGGLFLAREFVMRDGDTLYVTTAPFVRFQKIFQSIAPALGLAGQTRALSGL